MTRSPESAVYASPADADLRAVSDALDNLWRQLPHLTRFEADRLFAQIRALNLGERITTLELTALSASEEMEATK